MDRQLTGHHPDLESQHPAGRRRHSFGCQGIETTGWHESLSKPCNLPCCASQWTGQHSHVAVHPVILYRGHLGHELHFLLRLQHQSILLQSLHIVCKSLSNNYRLNCQNLNARFYHEHLMTHILSLPEGNRALETMMRVCCSHIHALHLQHASQSFKLYHGSCNTAALLAGGLEYRIQVSHPLGRLHRGVSGFCFEDQ